MMSTSPTRKGAAKKPAAAVPPLGGNIALVACGSFNPITFMHLRMMERARDHLQNDLGLRVIGGLISPTSDAYNKPGLASALHRRAMCTKALSSVSDQWIELSVWESMQTEWTPTLKVLDMLAKQASEQHGFKVRTVLVCGSDLLESFNKPGVWLASDIRKILTDHSLVVVGRPGHDARASIEANSTVKELRENVHLVAELVTNDLSSTAVRKAVLNGDSVKYLVADPVVSYIKKQGLYLEKPACNCGPIAPLQANKKRLEEEEELYL